MPELDHIMEELTKQTRAGTFKWVPSADSGVFVTSVGANSLIISRISDNSELVRDRHRLDILNKGGETVETVETTYVFEWAGYESDNDRRNELLTDLYAEARRSALEAETTLNEIAMALGIF